MVQEWPSGVPGQALTLWQVSYGDSCKCPRSAGELGTAALAIIFQRGGTGTYFNMYQLASCPGAWQLVGPHFPPERSLKLVGTQKSLSHAQEAPVILSECVLASCDCHNQFPQAQWLYTTQVHPLTALEAGDQVQSPWPKAMCELVGSL
jgi:hypothetical protein